MYKIDAGNNTLIVLTLSVTVTVLTQKCTLLFSL